jgi:autophagy-related protein 2
MSPEPQGGIHVEWQRVVFLFSRVPGAQKRDGRPRAAFAETGTEKRSSAFLVIGPLAPEADEAVLLPTVRVHSDFTAGVKKQTVTCRIPSVQAQIRQSTVEGLQFFADDMTHWLDGAFGDGSAPKPRDDLKMIGSRFFGSKASSSASSSVDDDEDDPAATLLRAMISECEVVLIVPKANADPAAPERILSLHASDVDVKLESNATDKQETSVTLVATDANLFHHPTPRSHPSRLFGRTTPLGFGQTQPVINLKFSSITHADRTKETGIRLAAASCGVFITKDLEWVHDLQVYAKTPEGVFEDVVPSEVTRIHLLLTDVSARADTPNLSGALVAVATMLEVRTALESDADDTEVDVGISGVHLLAVDDVSVTTNLADLPSAGIQNSLEAWKRAGFAHLAEVDADAHVRRSLVPRETLVVDVLHSKIRVAACADSLASLGPLAADLAKLAPKPVPEPSSTTSEHPPSAKDKGKRRATALEQTIDVFASIDLDAFGQPPVDIGAGADMIEDDLPTNLDYLDTAARQHAAAPRVDRKTGETLRSWETTDDVMHIAEGGATIKVFLPDAFEDAPGYWDAMPVVKAGNEVRMGRMRIRLHDCSVGVFLHDGYDWARTRKAIEDEIKAVRRRLEKIKQLLASGQSADASIEDTDTNAVLFNSVYIGLPDRADMDSAQLMAAIDEELLDLGAETATESSWQPLPKAPGSAYPHAASHAYTHAYGAPLKSSVKLHGKRLTRSKRGQIEFNLSGVNADIVMYAPDDETASRIHVTAQSFEILDHIKTSTWKKFLTEIKSDSRGNVRETDADMVRLELLTVRPNLPSLDEEIRVRVSVIPSLSL